MQQMFTLVKNDAIMDFDDNKPVTQAAKVYTNRNINTTTRNNSGPKYKNNNKEINYANDSGNSSDQLQEHFFNNSYNINSDEDGQPNENTYR